MKKLLKILGILCGILLLIVLTIFIGTKIKNKILFERVKAVVQTETEQILLPNEIIEKQESYYSSLGCHKDFKVRATRCNIREKKYYKNDANPVEKILEINSYLTKLGWTNENSVLDKREDMERLLKEGYLPFGIYSKHNEFDLRMHVNFFETIESFEEYGPTYSISISTDITR